MTPPSREIARLRRVAEASALAQDIARNRAGEMALHLREAQQALEESRAACELAAEGWHAATAARRMDPLLVQAWRHALASRRSQHGIDAERLTRCAAEHEAAVANWRRARARTDAAGELLERARRRQLRRKDERALAAASDLQACRRGAA